MESHETRLPSCHVFHAIGGRDGSNKTASWGCRTIPIRNRKNSLLRDLFDPRPSWDSTRVEAGSRRKLIRMAFRSKPDRYGVVPVRGPSMCSGRYRDLDGKIDISANG
eukprot:scaffold319_cov362-Pavlova_lutheri.AAC.11